MNKEKALIYTLAIIQFSHITDFMVLMPLGPQLMEYFSIKPAQFALLVSTYTFSAGISGFAGAFYIDRFDRRKTILIMASGFALGTLSCGLTDSYFTLLIARSITGAFGGVLGALILAIIGDAIPNERRASSMGIVMASFSLASVIGVPAGLYLATLSDWHLPFIILGVLAAISIIPIWFYIPRMTDHISQEGDKKSPFKLIYQLFTSRNQRKALLFGIVIMFSHFSIIPFISPYLVNNVGFTNQQITYLYLIGGALTIFSSPLIGRLSDRHGRAKVFSITVIFASIPVFFLTNIGITPVPLVLVITSMFFVFGAGRMIPSTAMVTSSVKPENRGSFMSLNSSFRQITNGTAAYLAGLIITTAEDGSLQNYNWVGYFAIAMGILSIFIGRGIKVVDSKTFTN